MQFANVVELLFNHPAFNGYTEFCGSTEELKKEVSGGCTLVCEEICQVARGKTYGSFGNFGVIPYVEVGLVSTNVLLVEALRGPNKRRILGAKAICQYLNQRGPRGFKFSFAYTTDGVRFTVNEVGA
jgi:hypothetical protein